MEAENLLAIFLKRHRGSVVEHELPSAFDAILVRLWEAGRAAWPGLDVGAGLFIRHLAERTPPDIDLARALAEVHAADLYLACACAHGLKGAVERFEASYAPTIAAFVRLIDGSPSFGDEVRQVLREKLFVHRNGELPKIAGYSGRGPLSSWVGVAAQRTGLSLVRGNSARDHTGDHELIEALPAGADPELDYLKIRYRTEFREAFHAALAALTQRERVILRLHLVSGMSHEKIGVLYKVNQSTVSRWIAKSRETIACEVQRHLHERLGVSRSDIGSLADLVASQLDLSLARWLGEERG
ncbi:sigma-70 family RNA polymerase sigma factor [Sorangium sp. So ce1099]|uniref:sigma-70 family RNA polymerase sigma factor n=1 Tax=Sorangium sp. So ce1099 TaxID=3133331 RepID=UPI003F5F687B